MRWICWASVPLAVLALMSPAAGFESVDGWGGTCASCEQCYTYGAPPCAAPFFGWQPGCCQEPPSPCDNAWAGYCHEKARWKAFWYRVGTGGRACCGSMPAGCQSMPVAPQPAGPAVPTTPAEPGKPLGPVGPGGLDGSAVPAAPGGLVEPPVPVPPSEADEGSLPPEPPAFEEPVAFPPMPRPLPGETTQRWGRFWLPRGSARQPATWPRLR
jgi:hypothetical protein